MAQLRPNRIKQKLAAGKTAIAVSGIGNTDMIDMMGPSGLDGVWLEGEHGPVDFGDIPHLTRACDLWGMTSIVRVNANAYGPIYRTLDVGAQAVCVPHVDTAEEARQFVEAAKFAPIGRRGLFTSRQGYGVPNFLEVANEQSMLIALIEDIKAVHNLDEILKVDHIDVFFVAPSDLAASMGHIGQLQRPEVQDVLHESLRKIIAAGRTAGTLAVDAERAEHFAAMGVRMMMSPVQPWLFNALSELQKRVSAAAK